MLHPLCISFGRFGRHTDRDKQIDHDPMTPSHLFRQRLSDLRQEYTAIGLPDHQPVALQAGDGLDGTGVGYAQTLGDVGRTRLALSRQQVRNQLDIILAECIRPCATSFSEAARLREFGWHSRRWFRSLSRGVRWHPVTLRI